MNDRLVIVLDTFVKDFGADFVGSIRLRPQQHSIWVADMRRSMEDVVVWYRDADGSLERPKGVPRVEIEESVVFAWPRVALSVVLPCGSKDLQRKLAKRLQDVVDVFLEEHKLGLVIE